MNIEGGDKISKTLTANFETGNTQQETPQSETPTVETTEKALRTPDEIHSEISSTARKLDHEHTALNEAYSKFNLTPPDSTRAIDALNTKHAKLTSELNVTNGGYEKAEDDPAIQETQRDIQARVGREYEQYVKGQWGKIAQEGARLGSGGSSRDQVEWRATNRAWDGFLITRPDIAEKYRGRFAEIDKAFQRRDLRQKAQEALRATYTAPEVVSTEEVISKISEQVEQSKDGAVATEPQLQARKKELAEKPIIDADVFREATAVLEEEPTFSWVATDKIVGRPFGEQNQGGWSFEYRGREGRIINIAQELSGAGSPEEAAEHIFHSAKPDERIKLAALEGPKGPMYSVQDGTHRVAGATLARLRQIPCDVRRIKYPIERITTVEDDVRDWRRKIDLGLIQGDIGELQNADGKKINYHRQRRWYDTSLKGMNN